MKTEAFSLSGIALGNLRRRKRQNLMLFLGIFLAVYFAAASLLFGFGIYTTLNERHMMRYGKQDAFLFNCGDAPLEELLENSTLSSIGKAHILAEVMVGDSDEDSFCVAQYDDEAMSLANKRLKEGEYPDEAGEIALEQSMLSRLRVDTEVGDEITLTLKIPDGEGFLSGTVEKTYTLTGILYDQLIYWDTSSERVYYDFPAGILSNAEQIEPGGRAVTLAYGTYVSGGEEAAKTLADFCEANGIATQNTYGFSLEYSEDQNSLVTGICMVSVGLLLLVACGLGIVNAFSANLDARRRQIGLLRAVGATRRQIKRIFGRETMILAAISVPVGLGLAILTVMLIFILLGENYILVLNLWVLLGVAALSIACVKLASGIPLRRAAAVSPMQAIRDVNLMRRVNKKTIRSKTQFNAPRLIASRSISIYKTKRAGISVMLASGILVFTLALIFMTAMYQQLLNTSYKYDYKIYDNDFSYISHEAGLIYGFHDAGLSEGDRGDIAVLPLVESVSGEKMVTVKLLPEELTPYATADGWIYESSYLSPGIPLYDHYRHTEWYERTYKEYQQVKSQYGYSDYLSVTAFGLEESIVKMLEPYVYEGSINMDKLQSGEEILIFAPEQYNLYYMEWDNGSSSYHSFDEPSDQTIEDSGVEEQIVSSHQNDMFHAGDTLTMSLLYSDGQEQYDDENNAVLPEEAIRIDKTVTIGAVLNLPDDDELSRLVTMYTSEFLNVVTTVNGLSALGFEVPYSSLTVELSETPDAQTADALHAALEQISSRIPGGQLSSGLERAEENRGLAVELTAIVIAICVLMVALTASMMINTLSAHIRSSRRSIGTQRAVGASKREIFQIYLYQALSLFIWGGGIGFILSVVIGYWFSQLGVLGFYAQPLPVWQPLVFIVLLLGICVLNIRTRLRGILRESITENIREL